MPGLKKQTTIKSKEIEISRSLNANLHMVNNNIGHYNRMSWNTNKNVYLTTFD